MVVLETAPDVDVDDPVRSHREVPGTAQFVCEDGCAETWRQRYTAIIPDAGADSAVDAWSVV